MAYNTEEVSEACNIHPCDTPRGCLYYSTKSLTSHQQLELNDMKLDIIRDDNKYLCDNPEIRAIVVLLLQFVLKHKPHQNLAKTISEFFSRPRDTIEDEVKEYIRVHQENVKVETEESVSSESSTSIVEEHDLEKPYSIQDVESEHEVEAIQKDYDYETHLFLKNLLTESIFEFSSPGTNTPTTVQSSHTRGITEESFGEMTTISSNEGNEM